MRELKSDVKNKNQINMVQVVPDSHYWTDLKQLIHWLDNAALMGKELTPEYLKKGLENTLMHGYNLKKVEEDKAP